MSCIWRLKDSSSFTSNMFVFEQTMPTDMRALQDFEEEDKLQIQMNDVITIIEGRSGSWPMENMTFSVLILYTGEVGSSRVLLLCLQGGALLVAWPEQTDVACWSVSPTRRDFRGRTFSSGHQPASQTLLHPHRTRRHWSSQELGTRWPHRQVKDPP